SLPSRGRFRHRQAAQIRRLRLPLQLEPQRVSPHRYRFQQRGRAGMVQIRQRLLKLCALAAALAGCAAATAAPRFYDDDPLERDPPPVAVTTVRSRSLNEYYDFLRNTFS